MGCEGPGASGDRGDRRLNCPPPTLCSVTDWTPLASRGMQSGCHWSQGTDEETGQGSADTATASGTMEAGGQRL